ncbi:hypothetical protein N7527_005490 [Penicillium freii]|nr:hypothetical protein N7527_005490 [Penicillium freii]
MGPSSTSVLVDSKLGHSYGFWKAIFTTLRVLLFYTLRHYYALYRADAAEYLKYAAIKIKEYYDRTYLPKHFARGYNIPINNTYTKKLGQQYVGCFTVLERIGRLAYRIDIPTV